MSAAALDVPRRRPRTLHVPQGEVGSSHACISVFCRIVWRDDQSPDDCLRQQGEESTAYVRTVVTGPEAIITARLNHRCSHRQLPAWKAG